jgi:hypothetical protein
VAPAAPSPAPVPLTSPEQAPTLPAPGNEPLASSPAGAILPDSGFQYPEALLLPLAFLIALAFLARAFTSDATPRTSPR